MTLLDRKILAESCLAFFAALAVLILLLFSRRLYDAVWMALSLGMTPAETLRLVGWSFPPLLAYAIPMASLVAILITFGRLEADREVLAWAAGGVPLARLLRAPLLAALLLSALTFYLAASPIPSARLAIDRFRLEGPADPLGSLRPGEVRRIGKTAFHVREVDPLSRRLEGVLVSSIENDGRTWIAARAAEWEVTDTAWVVAFQGGEILSARAGEPPRSVYFGRYDLALERPHYLRPSQADRKPFRDLLGSTDPADRTETARRITVALAIPVFVLLGGLLSAGGRSARSVRSAALGRAVLVFAIYYVGLAGLEALAEQGRIPAPCLALLDVGGIALGGVGLLRRERIG